MPARVIESPRIDLRLTLAPLIRGRGDPTTRFVGDQFVRATRTLEGPVTIRVARNGTEIVIEAWGAGSSFVLENAELIVGHQDDPSGFKPEHHVLRNLARKFEDLRMTGGASPTEALIPTIIEQKVAGKQARLSFRRLVQLYGERAPGPFELIVQPDPDLLASLPYWKYHSLGIERKRAESIRRVSGLWRSLERLASAPPADLRRKLLSIRGIGPWSAAEVSRIVCGDADAVSVGDFHTPHLVAWALAGEPRGDDDRMMELLAPYAGHRARAVRLLELGYPGPPKFGPRKPLRSIEAI